MSMPGFTAETSHYKSSESYIMERETGGITKLVVAPAIIWKWYDVCNEACQGACAGASNRSNCWATCLQICDTWTRFLAW